METTIGRSIFNASFFPDYITFFDPFGRDLEVNLIVISTSSNNFAISYIKLFIHHVIVTDCRRLTLTLSTSDYTFQIRKHHKLNEQKIWYFVFFVHVYFYSLGSIQFNEPFSLYL